MFFVQKLKNNLYIYFELVAICEEEEEEETREILVEKLNSYICFYGVFCYVEALYNN